MRWIIAAALFGAVISLAFGGPAEARPATQATQAAQHAAVPAEFSAARKKMRKARHMKPRHVKRSHVTRARLAARGADAQEFDGDRYAARGGAAERTFGRGMARATGATVRGTARIPGHVFMAGGSLLVEAERHLGKTASQLGLPSRLWCADFMNRIAPGHGTDRRARSWASAGRPAARGCVGCVAVLTRGRYGGHVGIVKGWNGPNPIIVSGNHNRRVGIGEYSAARLVALRQL